jgi:hypothetical protein
MPGNGARPSGPSIDYRNVFAADYTSATRFIQEHPWIADTLQTNGIKPAEAISVVFPELIRYTSLEDEMEIGALQVLYTLWGPDYADFSIGRFQMKPSFALQLEKDMCPSRDLGSDSTRTSRKERIDRLIDLTGQVRYLVLFFHYMDRRYAKTKWNTKEEKVRFYAAAYNCGYRNPDHYIRRMMDQKYFSTVRLSHQTYCYADIAAFYYIKTIQP